MNKLITLAFVFCTFFTFGQKKYFTGPVKIPILLSGNFAELRSNHFHSGIDIKTQGVEGIPVYAAADGFISRIAVSPTGYGNALYIDHPNGKTTVYGHLQSFRKDIAEYVKNEQYRQHSFRINLTVPPGKFSVKKNELIAHSGNSGSSGGPHLHFEIRDTKTENPLNPLKFGFDIKDTISPKIFALLIAPLSDTSHVNFGTKKKRYSVIFYDGKYHIKNNPVIPVYGKTGFGVRTNDYLNGSWSKCGIYSFRLTVDDELYFSNRLDRISFDKTRYINSFIDYESYINYKKRYQKTWINPGNKLNTYDYVKGDGAFFASDNKKHKIKIEVEDVYGNKSILEFTIISKKKNIRKTAIKHTANFGYDKKNSYKTADFEIAIPEGALYTDIGFDFKATAPPAHLYSGLYSKIYSVHKNTVPLQKAATIKLKAENVPEELKEKALIVNINDKTGKYSAAGGKYKNGWMESQILSFGDYAITVDTIPPIIKPLSIKSNKTLTEANRIRFRISDNLAGIDKIEGILDGKWALFEYDAKKHIISHRFDKKRFEFNKQHSLVLTVSDYRDNKTVYRAEFWK